MLPIRTILHPTDFSTHSDHAFGVACALARDYAARLVVLHVAPAEVVYSGLIGGRVESSPYWQALKERLSQLQMPDLRIEVEHRLEEGDPGTEIVRVADKIRCDLIVMGTHGRTGLGRALLGSVAEDVLRRAHCPVMTLKTATSPGLTKSVARPKHVTV
jgi:nucleotide-binding universal stress UspA family protein